MHIVLSADRCLGSTAHAVGTALAGQWAKFSGPPPPKGGGRISIVARTVSRDDGGMPITSFRVCPEGFHPSIDARCTADDLRQFWPDEAAAAIQAFCAVATPIC